MRYLWLFGGAGLIVGGVTLLSLLMGFHRFLTQMHVDTDLPWWYYIIDYSLIYGLAQLIRVGLNEVVDAIREICNPNAYESH